MLAPGTENSSAGRRWWCREFPLDLFIIFLQGRGRRVSLKKKNCASQRGESRTSSLKREAHKHKWNDEKHKRTERKSWPGCRENLRKLKRRTETGPFVEQWKIARRTKPSFAISSNSGNISGLLYSRREGRLRGCNYGKNEGEINADRLRGSRRFLDTVARPVPSQKLTTTSPFGSQFFSRLDPATMEMETRINDSRRTRNGQIARR